MNIPFDQILPVFFAAMKAGYAGGATKTEINGLPGSNMIRFEQDDFVVVDVYFTTALSDFSFGHTMISYKGELVWMMQYHGVYPKGAVPLLKKALLETYGPEKFVGGRGPAVFPGEDGYEYHNEVKSDDWMDFRGCEDITVGGGTIGWHDYHGGLVVNMD